MLVTLIQHANQLFAKNKEGELLKIKGLVIPKDNKPTAYYDCDDPFFKIVCQPNTSHDAEYVCNGVVNIY